MLGFVLAYNIADNYDLHAFTWPNCISKFYCGVWVKPKSRSVLSYKPVPLV